MYVVSPAVGVWFVSGTIVGVWLLNVGVGYVSVLVCGVSLLKVGVWCVSAESRCVVCGC